MHGETVKLKKNLIYEDLCLFGDNAVALRCVVPLPSRVLDDYARENEDKMSDRNVRKH